MTGRLVIRTVTGGSTSHAGYYYYYIIVYLTARQHNLGHAAPIDNLELQIYFGI